MLETILARLAFFISAVTSRVFYHTSGLSRRYLANPHHPVPSSQSPLNCEAPPIGAQTTNHTAALRRHQGPGPASRLLVGAGRPIQSFTVTRSDRHPSTATINVQAAPRQRRRRQHVRHDEDTCCRDDGPKQLSHSSPRRTSASLTGGRPAAAAPGPLRPRR